MLRPMFGPPHTRVRMRGRGFRLAHHVFEAPVRFARHEHRHAQLVLVYRGQWEASGITAGASQGLLHFPGVAHESGVLSGGAEVITVQLARSRITALWPLYGAAHASQSTLYVSFRMLDGIPERLHCEIARNDAATPFIADALLTQLLAVSTRHPAEQREARPAWLTAVTAYITECLSEPLTVTALAKVANMSPSHLTHVFPRIMGCTVGAYVRAARIEAAATALRTTELPIQEIAFRAGFYDQAHLTRTFKSVHGMTPREYRATSGFPIRHVYATAPDHPNVPPAHTNASGGLTRK